MEIQEYLRSRGISEEIIDRFKEEKVDVEAIGLMNDDNLKDMGLMNYGDRVCVAAHAKSLLPRNHTLGGPYGKTLVDRISGKLKENQRSQKLKGNRNATRVLRHVELGLMINDKQVRSRRGGGIRHVKVAKSTCVLDLKIRAEDLFFPEGMSCHHGEKSKFNITIRSQVVGDPLLLTRTVEELYDEYKMHTLRLYLYAEEKKNYLSPDASQTEDIIREQIDDILSNLFDDQSSTRANNDAMLEADISDIITFPARNNQASPEDMDETLPCPVVYLHVHRGNVLTDLENCFHNYSPENLIGMVVHTKMIASNGEVEIGEDNGGVFRDCLAEYWNSFYDQRTSGSNIKIPSLAVNVDCNRWKSSGMILAIGYIREQYLPIQLSPSFLEYVLSGKEPSKESLIPEFMQYLPESDRKTINEALQDFTNEDLKDDIIEFFSDWKSHMVPNEENFKAALADIAHTVLIQEPAYIADTWRPIFRVMAPYLKQPIGDFADMKPTFRKLWNCIQFPEDLSLTHKKQQDMLKDVLKHFDYELLKRFLRFCTGADIFLGKVIQVNYVKAQTDFSRRMVAHTCSCILDMPDSYSSAIEMRHETISVLNAGVWDMDFV